MKATPQCLLHNLSVYFLQFTELKPILQLKIEKRGRGVKKQKQTQMQPVSYSMQKLEACFETYWHTTRHDAKARWHTHLQPLSLATTMLGRRPEVIMSRSSSPRLDFLT